MVQKKLNKTHEVKYLQRIKGHVDICNNMTDIIMNILIFPGIGLVLELTTKQA